MRLIGVGVGPGDPELVTVKAAGLLAAADRVFVPVSDPRQAGRAEAIAARYADPDRIERLVFGLGAEGGHERHRELAAARVVDWSRGAAAGGAGADREPVAVFATLGDPNLYSTFGYLARAVRERLPEATVETVPGITAMQALAAAAGTPLAEGGEPLVLLPVIEGPGAGAPGLAWLERTLAGGASVVAYKCGRRLPALAEAARAAGRTGIVGVHLGTDAERVFHLPPVSRSHVDGDAPYLSAVLLPPPRHERGGHR